MIAGRRSKPPINGAAEDEEARELQHTKDAAAAEVHAAETGRESAPGREETGTSAGGLVGGASRRKGLWHALPSRLPQWAYASDD